MAYNIYEGGLDAGADASDRPARRERIAAVIARARPDLLVLCECDGFERDDGRALDALAQRLGMDARLLHVDSGHHLALLVRDAAIERFGPLEGPFHHGAFQASLALPDGALQVFGTHLSPFDAELRVEEARCIAAQLRAPCVLLGDLNALSPRDAAHHRPADWPARYRARHGAEQTTDPLDMRAIEVLEDAGLTDLMARAHPGAFAPTRPTQLLADRPPQRLDYIFASAELAARLRGCEVIADPDAELASDHRPLLATLA